jgi:putative phage-type endonuclease
MEQQEQQQPMEQRSAEWFAARRGRITASSVGAILGNSPHTNRDDVMRRMVREWHGAENEFQGNIATEYGTFHEDGALVEYQMETGNAVTLEGFVMREDWAGASPDGLINLTGGLEIKCPFGKRKMTADDEFKTLDEQPHYHDQVQFSLWVCERAWWDFYQWTPVKTSLVQVMPCSKWRAKNLPKLRQFFAEYLHEREHNAAPYLEDKRVEIDTLEAARMVAEWDELTEAEDRAKERKNDLLLQMVQHAGSRNAVFAGRNLTLTKRKGPVAYAKALAELFPDADVEKWRGKPSESWGLR